MRIVVRHYYPGEAVVLYDANIHKTCRGVLYIHNIVNSPTPSYRLLAVGGVVISLVGLMSVFLPVGIAEAKLRLASISQTSVSEFEGKVYKKNEFKLIIPKINIEENIIANIDPTSREAYDTGLKKGIAHASGSYLPGEGGTVYLFSHSTDSVFSIAQYNAQFYGLKYLTKDDEIEIIFRGNKYKYRVSEKKVVNPADLNIIRQSKAALVLQTCWPPGTDWQRLIIFADQLP